MKVVKNIRKFAVITVTLMLVSTSAGAWWDDDRDYWDDGPWAYPGYGGWGGYPGWGGWGGYPGWGGWGGYPGYGGWGGWGGYPGYGGWGHQPRRIVINTEPRAAGSSRDYSIE